MNKEFGDARQAKVEVPRQSQQDSAVSELPAIPATVTNVQVMFFDTDCAAVVHNIAYLRFIETARTHLAEAMGMTLRQMSDSGEVPVVVRTEIDYKLPAVLGDFLEIRATLEKMERSRFWVALQIIRPADGRLIVKCRQLLAMVRLPGGRVMRIPAELFEKYRHAAPASL